MPDCQYSREELIELMSHPLSCVKHPCLESPQNKCLVSGRTGGRWLEDRWDHRKRTDSLTDEDRSESSHDPQKKRMNDPKADTLRKEQEVVLGPQRRSFNSGCFVNLQQVNSTKCHPDSPLKERDREPSHREVPTRRIGSGRIVRDPVWDFRFGEKEDVASQNTINYDYNYRLRDDRDRYERRTYDKDRSQPRNSRYNERKKYEPEEPEWFSAGPTSQHDTIELHGFDGPVEDKVIKKQSKSNKSSSKNSRKFSETNNKNENTVAKKTASRKSTPEVIEPRLSASPLEAKKVESQQSQSQDQTEGRSKDPECVFDIEDIFNFDSLPPLLTTSNGCVEDGGSGSRFSQFFHRESSSPKQSQESQRSSVHDEMFNSMINDLTNTSVTIPPDGNTYFAPISPAAPSKKEEAFKGPSASLLEVLQRGNHVYQGRKITKKPSLRDLEVSGKIYSVEELEARLRQEQGLGKPKEYSNHPSSKDEELAVFRKLMMSNQAQNMHDTKPPSHPNTGIFQGQQSQQQTQQQTHGICQQQQQQQQQMPIPHDLVMKLLHVQQQQRQQQDVFPNPKLLAPPRLASTSQFSIPPPIPPLSPDIQMHINNAQPTKELLQRPEAQTILRSLKRGDITIIHLIEQLKHSTTMQPIHREIIASIIKIYNLQSNVTQREPSPSRLAPPTSTEQLLHQMMHNQQSQQQQLRIPSPHANTLQRVPSPRELVAHTQNILQNALLKKKLEEQKENFRKRQELQRSHSPNMSVGGAGSLPVNQQPNTTSPTPLAFTPTSVLRKMTADKDADLGVKQYQHPDISQQPPKQGRAIVKGNNDFSVPPPMVSSNIDYMSLTSQFKAVQRNKIQQPSLKPQHYMMGSHQPSSSRVHGLGGSNMLPQQQQGVTQSVQQLLMNYNYNNPQQRNTALHKPECQPMMPLGTRNNYNMNYQGGSHELSASPVSSQLARWFSPELLAQARAGKLPDMPPISPTQNMLSVEELERLQQAVHN